ncbi:MAG TPA: transglutaminase-like domain-containing protein [Anaerolineae bacterium]|nr:transglutaminase-like domain-containing protein [Anaerolineae bacterium]
MMKTKQLLYKVLLGIGSGLLFAALTLAGYFWLPARVRYTITERYRFTAPGEGAHVALGVLLPTSGPYQTVGDALVTWEGAHTRVTTGTLTLLQLTGDVQGDAEAIVRFAVTLPVGRAVWDGPVADFQRAPQPDVESNAKDVMAQATEFAPGDAYAVYDFVAGYLKWPTGARMNVAPSALDALHTRVGGCNEFANLAVALYRANGIPAQTITGLAFLPALPFTSKTREWLHPAGAHAWVEVYADGQWRMADPSWASRIPLHRLYWGRNDGQHLAYGEAAQESVVAEQMRDWALTHGDLLTWMTAPSRFVATASHPETQVVPVVTVQRGWDGRFFNILALWTLSVLGICLIGKRFQRREA